MCRILTGLLVLLSAIQNSPLASAQNVCCAATACDASCCCSSARHDRAGSCCHRDGICERWLDFSRALEEDCGIKFEGGVSQFYQGVSSGGLDRQFRYGGHAEYDLDLDFGKICGWDGYTLKVGSEHRFGENVNGATGSLAPVAVALNLPDPETTDLALIEVRFGIEINENVELFVGKLDALSFDRNVFAFGNGDDKFFNSPFNYNSILKKTIPYSALGTGFNVFRADERVFTLAVLNSEETPTTIGINDLFANGAVIISELRLPVTLFGRSGHQTFGGTWSSRTFSSLRQEGRIEFPDIPIAAKSGSWALGWNADQFLWQDPCDPSRGWGLFGRAGITDGNPNPIKWSVSFGVGGQSQLAGREDDESGVGWYYIGISDEFGPLLANLIEDGQGVELYYDIAMSERFRLTLDLQVVEPNFAGADTAVVPGIRGRLEF